VYAIYIPSFLLGAVLRRTRAGRTTGTIRACANIVMFGVHHASLNISGNSNNLMASCQEMC